MCGRFAILEPEKIEKRYTTSNKLPLFNANYNIAPSIQLPVITKNSPNKIQMMFWGFIPDWDIKSSGIINIRSETAVEKQYFVKKLKNQRCLIPTNGFYEWGIVNLEGKEEKYPFYFHLIGNPLFSFAGIYNETKALDGKTQLSFAILTCSANQLVGRIHSRMPVIIEKVKENAWLDQTTKIEQIENLMRPYPADKMKHYPVSKKVNNPANNDPTLIIEEKLF